MVGFADGLQKGFGMVNDVYERRSKDQYRQEVIADSRGKNTDLNTLVTIKIEIIKNPVRSYS